MLSPNDASLIRNAQLLDWIMEKVGGLSIPPASSAKHEVEQAIKSRKSFLPLTAGAYDA